jgi:chromosome segregation ATPase
MSTALSNIEWGAVTSSLSDIHAGNEEAEQFIGEMLDELDQLRHDLHNQDVRLQRERFDLDERRTKTQSSASALDEDSQRELDQLGAERVALQEERDAAHVQLAKMATTALDLATARVELSETRKELTREREKLAADDDTKTELLHRVGELEQERALLEAELESVRRRAAELSEALERKEWRSQSESGQPAAAARPISQTSQKLQPPEPAAPEVAAADNSASPALQAKRPTKVALGEDAALESVMAQFEMIQRDIARRRAKQRSKKP